LVANFPIEGRSISIAISVDLSKARYLIQRVLIRPPFEIIFTVKETSFCLRETVCITIYTEQTYCCQSANRDGKEKLYSHALTNELHQLRQQTMISI